MTMQTSILTADRGNHDDPDYDAFIGRLNARFNSTTQGAQVFKTDADGLFAAYLDALPADQRQYHTCSCCRNFIGTFGGLVTIDAAGRTESAMWNEDDAPELYRPSIAAVLRAVRRAKVASPFLSSEKEWGRRETGIWHHFAVMPPVDAIYKASTLTAGQKMAEKREDFKTVMHALNEFTQPHIEQALSLLKTDALYRSEKVMGPAQWLYDLHVARAAAHGSAKANVVWRAIASAPAGFCHPRSSMIGTLLEDIAAGMDFGDVSRRFAAKMGPLQYQRPQAAPTAGAIAAAEKVMAQLGAAGSLARRFARLDEVQPLWLPAPRTEPAQAAGVFGHLTPKGEAPSSEMRVPPITMTWEKFARTVLPEARQIDLMVPAHGDFCALVTAENPDAPPILQWDTEQQRNPVSWYVYNGGSSAAVWGLAPGWRNVPAITLQPSAWFGGKFDHQGGGALFLLDGAKDSRNNSLALFPETLKAEFHGIRSVIEAYSRSAKLGGEADASANGLVISKGRPCSVHLRITLSAGPRVEYRLDRWD